MLFITPSEVVDYSFLPRENIVSDSIRSTKIDIAQERFLRPRLGDAFYSALCDGRYPAFVDTFLKPTLAFYVRYGLLEEYSVVINENGIVVFGGDTEVGLKEGSVERTGSLSRNLSETRDEIKSGTGSETREGTGSDTRTDTITDQGTDKLVRTGTDTKTSTIDATGKVTKTDIISDNLMKDSTTNTTSHVASEPWEEKTFLSTTATSKTNNYTTDTLDNKSDTLSATNSLNDTRTTSDTRAVDVISTEESLLSVARTDSDSLDATRTSLQSDATLVSDATTGTTDTSRRRYTPASKALIHTLQLRALSDGNTLMGKALRYVKSHLDDFPEYVTRSRTIL